MRLNKFWCTILFVAVISKEVLAQDGTLPVQKTPSSVTVGRKQITSQVSELPTQPASKERLVEISTDCGVMVAKLYDSTPLHRDNFIKLIEQKFYDSLLFHRVISQFMIQGGDPTSKNATNGVPPGDGSAPGDRIPAEFKPYFFHKKGALAAARDENAEKASTNSQFYIVQGRVISEQDLNKIYNERVKVSNSSFTYTKLQREIYSRIGGTPFLDQSYTVFGEVVSGLDVIDKIANMPKDASDKPLQSVHMKISLLN